MEYAARRKLTWEFKPEAGSAGGVEREVEGPAGSGAGCTRGPVANVAARVREGGGDRHRQA